MPVAFAPQSMRMETDTEKILMEPSPSASCVLRTSLVAKSGGMLVLGAALGMVGLSMTEQGRLRAPVDALDRSHFEDATELVTTLPKFPVKFSTPATGYCGAARCFEGALCCPGGPGYGHSCGSQDAVCCQGYLYCEDGSKAQVGVAIVCAAKDVCCVNDHGDPYCCASGNQCHSNVCAAGDGQCFSGDASVSVEGQGPTRLAEVNIGDKVFVGLSEGVPQFETVVDFLHATSSPVSSYVTISHEHGELRVSGNHLVFLQGAQEKAAATIEVGDELWISADDIAPRSSSSRVLAVDRSEDAAGMYAPLTASGKVVVDGVVASNFALPTSALRVSHCAMFASFFLRRVVALLSSFDFTFVSALPVLSAVVFFRPFSHNFFSK